MIQRISNKLESFFQLSKNNTTIRTEVLAGLTTFITVAYILILNPQILSHPYQIMGDMDMAARISNGVFIGTCLASFVGTILCALYAKVPFVQAPGMGLNAFLPTPWCWPWVTPIPSRWWSCSFRVCSLSSSPKSACARRSSVPFPLRQRTVAEKAANQTKERD